MLSYLELVELPNGDIVLQRSEGDDKPIVTIRFSNEARDHISGSHLELAKVMIQAGLEAAQLMSDDLPFDDEEGDEGLDELEPNPKTVH